jgi:hypothetical protein
MYSTCVFCKERFICTDCYSDNEEECDYCYCDKCGDGIEKEKERCRLEQLKKCIKCKNDNDNEKNMTSYCSKCEIEIEISRQQFIKFMNGYSCTVKQKSHVKV